MAIRSGIVFIGGRDRAYECIQSLLEKGESIIHIFCMPEDVHERVKYAEKISELARKNGIPITVTKTVNNSTCLKLLQTINPELVIVMGWRTIIPKKILDFFEKRIVAVHESLLPRYRGFAPVNWVIINGEEKTGVTLFHLDEGMDSGNIIDHTEIIIEQSDTAFDLYKKTKDASIELVLKHLSTLKKAIAPSKKQVHKLATYTVARNPEDGLINWNMPTKIIYNLIRGLSHPYPGAFCYYKGKKIVIQKASYLSSPRRFIGVICGRVATITEQGVEVLTGDGSLRIEELEVDGKFMKANEYISSIKGTLTST